MKSIKAGLVVSCQALPDEPLHSSFIMGRMALAAKEGGAKGIRANSVADILEIKKQVALPVIAIIKRGYPDAEAFITPTMREIDELMEVHPEIIALDATASRRPYGQSLTDFYRQIRAKYPQQRLMADCSTLEEMLLADRLGFDYIGTTLVGYTKQSQGLAIEADDFGLIREALHHLKQPLIAEGNIDSPEKVRRVLDLGAYSVVVGSAITRPQVITKRFVDAVYSRE